MSLSPDRAPPGVSVVQRVRRHRLYALSGLVLAVFVTTITTALVRSSHAQVKAAGQPAGYIVVLKGDPPAGPEGSQQVRRVAAELLTVHGGSLDRVFGTALNGFSAQLTVAQRDAIAADPRVSYVEADGMVRTQQPR